MTTETSLTKRTSMEKLKLALSAESVQAQFQNALRDNSGPFVASIIDLVASDTTLRQCDPGAVIMECLKAATLKLPINKQLGFAYVIPYKVKGAMTPQFQLGYKGYIQLAMRSGQYRFLNATTIPEGIEVKRDILTGQITFDGDASGPKVQGYCAYLELMNGFSKAMYMTKAEVDAHAQRFSKSYPFDTSAWKTDFDAMAVKTVLRRLLSKFGVMSVEMVAALVQDVEDDVAQEIAEHANGEVIDVDEPTGEITDPELTQQRLVDPGF